MKRWLAASIALSFLTVAARTTTVHAQVGSVRGKVVDSTGRPIAGAIIVVDRTAVRAQATSTGGYLQRTIRVHARGADYREVGGRSGGYLDERERRFISTKLRAVREYLPIRRDAPAISRRRNARVEESVSRAAASGLVLR